MYLLSISEVPALRKKMVSRTLKSKNFQFFGSLVIINSVRRESITASGFEIYVTDPAYFEDKPYRLVWTLHPDEDYLGVVNAFRRSHAKISKRR